MIAILKKADETRRVHDESEDYDYLVSCGWDIYDIIDDDEDDFDDGVRWHDGSKITAADREHLAGAVRVRYQLHELKGACDAMGLTSYELDSFGSRYLNIEVGGNTVKARIADHARLSALHEAPDFNIAPGCMTVDEVVASIRACL